MANPFDIYQVAAEPFQLFGLVLLQSNSVMQERVPSVQKFGDYIRAIEATVEDTIVKDPEHIPAAGFVVVALRPNGKSNAWLDFSPPLSPGLAAQILSVVKTLQPMEINQGVVVFAIKVSFWGAREPEAKAPSPEEWKLAVHKIGRPVELDELVETIWPE